MAQYAGLTLQTKIYDALVGSAPLMAVVTGVFDDAPTGQTYPYVELADIVALDNGTKTDEGFEHRIEIHVWSRAHGQAELFEIFGLIDNVLHDQPLTLVDHRLINLRKTTHDTLRDIDPKLRHGIMRFRAVTEAI